MIRPGLRCIFREQPIAFRRTTAAVLVSSSKRERLGRLSEAIRRRLTLGNDDRVFRPADLLPVCRDTGVPLVYDVPAGWLSLSRCLTVEVKATEVAVLRLKRALQRRGTGTR